MLVTLPPGSKGVWMSCQTSVAAVFVHTIVFTLLVYYMVDILRALGYKEGFEGGITGWLSSLFGARDSMSTQRTRPVAPPSTRLTLPLDGTAHVRRAYDENAESR